MKLTLPLKVVVALSLLTSSFSAWLHADLPAEVAEILEANIEASGGRDLISSIESSRLKGSIAIPAIGMTGTTELVMKSPGKLYVAQEIPGMGKMVQAFDGETGWANDAMQGFRLLSEGEIASLRQNDNFSDMLKYNELYSSGELLTDAEVDGQATSVVKLVALETGLEQTCYYSKESGHMLRMDMIVDMGPMGKLPASLKITSHIEQGGISFPATMEMTNAGMVINMTFETLEINQPIEDSLFAAPQ